MTKARDIASAAPAPSTVSATELGYVDGVTSAIQTQLDAKTAKSTLSTTGDIYYASAANTPARLGIGSTDQVLKVSGGIPAWATPSSGSMTLLSTTTLSGASTTISSIDQTYNSLFLIVSGVTSSGINRGLNIRPNNSTTDCSYAGVRRIASTSANANGSEDSDIELAFNTETDKTSAANAWAVTFHNYASTTSKKPFHFYGEWYNAGSNTSNFAGAYTENTAITSLVFRYAGDTMTGGTVLLYGVK